MEKVKCLGLIGGLGVGAATHYYKELAKAHATRDSVLDFVMVHAETPRVFDLVRADDRPGLAAYLNSFILRLQAAGADAVAIPAVTPHFCIRELQALSPLPLFNLFEPLKAELKKKVVRRVAVFGTRFVIESDLFDMAGDIEIVRPRPEEVDSIHNIYTALAARGTTTEEDFQALNAIAHALLDREQIDAIILAGTDLSLLFHAENTSFPAIDCAALHLRAISDAMLRP